MIVNETGSGTFRPRSILYGDRYKELDQRESYYACTQHDWKLYDFDGRVVSPKGVQPLMSAEKSPIYIPLKMRRPAAPIRMGKIIVNSFTNLLFGENRFPNVTVDGDEKTQDFAQTIARVGRLPMAMIRARNIGGSTGTVGLSWCYKEGVPSFSVHNSKNLYVHSWIDREALLPRHVTEVYMFYKMNWDGKGFNKAYYWFRRDWTPDADFIFEDVPYEKDKDPIWKIDEEKSNRHEDGIVHFEWIQNLPTDEIDGEPDYEGLYEQFDQIDILNSVISRGAILNLDPTLKLKMDPDQLQRTGVKKGSDNALIVGKDGDADYLELSGTSLEAGVKLFESARRSILETSQCIVPDPNEVAAQGVSSVAIKAMFSPMLAKADILREQYAQGVKRVLENMIQVAKVRTSKKLLRPLIDPNTKQPSIDPVTGEELMEEVTFVIAIPPKVEVIPKKVLDPSGVEVVEVDPKTGEPMVEIVKTPREPGEGGEISLTWPAYFAPTYEDQSKIIGAMQVATGGKGFVSVETATDIVSAALGVNPEEEKKRFEKESKSSSEQTATMFPSTGGAPPPMGNSEQPEPVAPPIEDAPQVDPVV